MQDGWRGGVESVMDREFAKSHNLRATNLDLLPDLVLGNALEMNSLNGESEAKLMRSVGGSSDNGSNKRNASSKDAKTATISAAELNSDFKVSLENNSTRAESKFDLPALGSISTTDDISVISGDDFKDDD